MIERLRCRYVRAVILLFSVTRVEKGAAQPKRIVSFSDEHVVHKKDGIFWDGDIIPTRIISPSIIESQSNENDEEGISWKKLRSNLFSNDDDYDTRLKENRLCDIGDGYVYREGEKLDTFDTRCGSMEYFPCYCDPDLEPPISCPYCGFHAPPPPNPELQADANANRKALSNSDDFFCLKSGETSGPFLGSAGSLQMCSCTALDFQPVSTCAPPKTQIITIDDLRSDDDEEGGNEDDVQAQAIPNNNNSNSPSFTSNFNTTPNSNGGEEDDANDEATPDYSITYNSYIKSNSPSSGPSPIDTNLFFVNEPGAFDEPTVREPLEDENVVSNNDIDLPSKRTVPINKSAESNGNSNGGDDVCTIVLEGTGETKILQRGESYGSYLSSKCSKPEDFPCFCNPDLVDQAECPHCGFLTGNGTVLCAHHEKTVSFPSPGGGGVETCTCMVSTNPAYRPIEACAVTSHTDDRSEKSSGTYQDMFVRDNGGNTAAHNIGDETGGDSDGTDDGDDKSTGSSRSNIEGCDITDPTTGNNVTVPIGHSFTDYLNVEGPCGDGIEWPAYCSASWSETASTGVPDDPPQHIPYVPNLHESNNVSNKNGAVFVSHRMGAVYPYCIYTNTLSNTPVCARSNDGVVYTTDQGERIECFCTYSSHSGPVSTCYPYPRDDTTTKGSTRSYDMDDPGLKFSGQQEQLPPPRQPPTYSPVVTPTPPPPTFAPSIRVPADYYSSGSVGRNTVGESFVVFGTMVSTVVWMLASAVTSAIL